MTFEIGMYVLSAFFIIFGAGCLWWALQHPAPSKNLRVHERIFHPSKVFLTFAFLFIALSHFSMYAGLAYGISFTNQAECENLLMNTTQEQIDPSDNSTTTLYAYADSCAARSVPEASQNMFRIFTWVLLIEFFGVWAFMFVWWGRSWFRSW